MQEGEELGGLVGHDDMTRVSLVIFLGRIGRDPLGKAREGRGLP